MSKISYFSTNREYTTFFSKPAAAINFDSKHILLQSLAKFDPNLFLIKIRTVQNASHPDYSAVSAIRFGGRRIKNPATFPVTCANKKTIFYLIFIINTSNIANI